MEIIGESHTNRSCVMSHMYITVQLRTCTGFYFMCPCVVDIVIRPFFFLSLPLRLSFVFVTSSPFAPRYSTQFYAKRHVRRFCRTFPSPFRSATRIERFFSKVSVVSGVFFSIVMSNIPKLDAEPWSFLPTDKQRRKKKPV